MILTEKGGLYFDEFWFLMLNYSTIIKVKWSLYKPGVAQRVGRGIALLFNDRGTRRGWVVSSTPGRILPPGKTRYPFYRRLGGPQGRSGRAENLVPTGIRSRTVQPLVSRYTDWATRSTQYRYKLCIANRHYTRMLLLQVRLPVLEWEDVLNGQLNTGHTEENLQHSRFRYKRCGRKRHRSVSRKKLGIFLAELINIAGITSL